MAKRKKRKKKPILLTVVLLLLSALLLADLIAARVYMRHTEADFFTALLQTTRLGGQYVVNLLSPADQSIPVNPYSQTDYYKNGDYTQRRDHRRAELHPLCRQRLCQSPAHLRKAEGEHSPSDVRDPRAGGGGRQDHCP